MVALATRRVATFCALYFLLLVQGLAGERKEWVTLTECQYVVSSYNDGDSFRIQSGTNHFLVRLYFVDAPEMRLLYPDRVREQSQYFGVTLDETLKAGVKARDLVKELLNQPFVVRTRWALAAGHSKEARFYAFVELGDQNLAEQLVARGFARTKGVTAALPTGVKSKEYVKKLQDLETEARRKRVGVWASSDKNSTAPGDPQF